MFFVISKLLAFALQPFIWVFSLLVLAILLQKKRKKLLLAALIVFYFFSNAFIYDEFSRWYEYESKPIDAVPTCKVGIVLGGYSSYDPHTEQINFQQSTDRLNAALLLYRKGKIGKILLSGGTGSLTDQSLEADYIATYLRNIGIPKRDILIESESRNTHQNAIYTAQVLQENDLLSPCILITSAYHMPRAKRCFTKAGIEVEDFSVDRTHGPRKFYFDHLFIPNLEAMFSWSGLIKEWIGMFVYKVMGYI
jgi:uncharacterized SAM-binding protein YcdF (DUF218 family)